MAVIHVLLLLITVLLSSSSCIHGADGLLHHVRRLLQSTNGGGNEIGGTIGNPIDIAPIQNPYGMVVVPNNAGQWQKDDLLISGWDAGTPPQHGQGNTIVVVRNGKVQSNLQITISQTSNQIPYNECKVNGIGFTMAMVYLTRDNILQCTVPIANNGGGPVEPGCCFIISSRGNVLATFRNNNINGPWGAAVTTSGSNTYVFISMVLGGQGSIVRYKFNMPNDDNGWKSGDGTNNIYGTLGQGVVIANGFKTQGSAGIGAGNVGPSGLVYSNERLYVAASLDGAGGFGQIIQYQSPLSCSSPQTCQNFRSTLHTCSGPPSKNNGNSPDCHLPIGLNIINGNLVTPNGLDGNILEYDLSGNRKSFRTIAQSFNGNTDGANGFLFNVISNRGQTAFVDDALNTVSYIAPVGQTPITGAATTTNTGTTTITTTAAGGAGGAGTITTTAPIGTTAAVGAATLKAVAVLVPATGSTVHGTILFSQTGTDLTMTGTIFGLSANSNLQHGWHVHEKGDISDGACKNVLNHYNPLVKNHHGGPTNDINNRHIGDFGNLDVPANTEPFTFTQVDNVASLSGPYSILSRGIVIHDVPPDDLGLGVGAAQAGSQANGNSGARLACGVIGIA